MTTATKQIIESKWSTKQIHEETARLLASQWMAAYGVICKHGEEAIKEFETVKRQEKVAYFKALKVTTPIELVKAMAEFEANVFGSKIEIWGDEKEASMSYKTCGMWEALKKYGHMNKEQEEKMGAQFENCTSLFAKEFGFKGETKFEGENCVTLTFTKA